MVMASTLCEALDQSSAPNTVLVLATMVFGQKGTDCRLAEDSMAVADMLFAVLNAAPTRGKAL